ncbi:MAG: hypothetical protein ACYCW6_18380 [Candidatus Xenobia bacterium]
MAESVSAINASVTQQVSAAAARNVQTLGGAAEKTTQTIQDERPEDRYQEGEADPSSLESNKQLKQMALQYGGGAQSSAQAEEKGNEQKAEERQADGDGNARYQMDQLRRMANLNAQWSGPSEQPVAAEKPAGAPQPAGQTAQGPAPSRTAPISPRPTDPQTTRSVAQSYFQNRSAMIDFARRVPSQGNAAADALPRLPSNVAAERFGNMLGYFRSDQSNNPGVMPQLKPYAQQVGADLQAPLDLANSKYDATVARLKGERRDPGQASPPLYHAAKAIAAQEPDFGALNAPVHAQGKTDPALWLAAHQFAQAYESDQAAATAAASRPAGPGQHLTGPAAWQQFFGLGQEARSSYMQAAAQGGRFAPVPPDMARQRFELANNYLLTNHAGDAGVPSDRQQAIADNGAAVQRYHADAQATMHQNGEDPSDQNLLMQRVAQRALQDVNPRTGHANLPGYYAMARQYLESSGTQQPMPSIPPQQTMHPYSAMFAHVALASMMMPWVGMMAFNPFLMGAFM